MKLIFTIASLFCASICHAVNDTIVEPSKLIDISLMDTTIFFYPTSDYEYVPGEANYDLIKDRLSCIENEIPLHYNDKVHAFVNYFIIKDRAYTKMVLDRIDLYFPIFEKYLAEYGLPDELKYLAIIESGLNPKANSHAGAGGLWQFMPATGKHFGLHQDWYIDERMDPEKATEAACKFLKELYNTFEDWELAISAYNTGAGNVRKAIRRSGYKRSFWEIYPYLYRETRSYLPQFIAMNYVMNYAHEHNFVKENVARYIKTDTILVSDYLHCETLADHLNICIEDLELLNPGLKRKVVPENTKGYVMRIPADTKTLFDRNRTAILDSCRKVGRNEIEAMAKHVQGNTYGREKVVYRVRSGDVLGIIAERHHVRVSDLKQWNNLYSNTIRIGQKLNVWVKPGNTVSTPSNTAPPQVIVAANGRKTYVVQQGDTLWDISRKFEGLSIETIKQLNRLDSNKIKPGQKLVVSAD